MMETYNPFTHEARRSVNDAAYESVDTFWDKIEAFCENMTVIKVDKDDSGEIV